MAQNYLAEGEVLLFVNDAEGATAIASGDVVVVGKVAGVALVDIAADAEGSVQIEGVFQVAKTTSLAISQGDELFWNTSTKKVTKTATDFPIGIAYEGAASAATTCYVKLAGGGNSVGQAAVIAALTDNSGGTAADGTIAAITAGTPASLAAQGTINGLIADAVTELAAKQNAVIAALKAAGLMASS